MKIESKFIIISCPAGTKIVEVCGGDGYGGLGSLLQAHQEKRSPLTHHFSRITSHASPFKGFDVLLAYNRADKAVVRAIAQELKQRGLKPWFDEEQLPPGRWFQDVIQKAITNVKCVTIFIGPQRLGKWQEVELRSFISLSAETSKVSRRSLPGQNFSDFAGQV